MKGFKTICLVMLALILGAALAAGPALAVDKNGRCMRQLDPKKGTMVTVNNSNRVPAEMKITTKSSEGKSATYKMVVLPGQIMSRGLRPGWTYVSCSPCGEAGIRINIRQ